MTLVQEQGQARMCWTVLTLFPDMFEPVISSSLFGKARERGLLDVRLVDYRQYANGKHKAVDDTPFGGGAGMVIKVEPLAAALDSLRRENPAVYPVLLRPQGRPFDQQAARRLSNKRHVALVCGRYEGMDERIAGLVDEEISIGDYVLSGGEAAAWVVMDAVSRLVPGVVGEPQSVVEESFGSDNLLEHPHYTRPREFRGMTVPEVLLSGDHAAIELWRRRQSIIQTARRRPDLLAQAELDDDERAWLKEMENDVD